uniref:DNA_mis_repair domain-containing protein n=1 Tax=Strongyloides stercoralis TaxID=6248 RepID=A0A0K0E0I8_STRER
MPSIERLDEEVCRRLTTGQVCVDLGGVIKELIDNSLDAGGTRISIKLFNDGINKIQVEDNGSGIKCEDFEMICELHATSKIKNYEDFTSLSTYGFRGEALNSLCCSSKVTIMTKVKDGPGYQLEFDSNGKYLPERTREVSSKVGTTVVVTDFMCNFPVRRNEFMSKSGKEIQKVVKILQNYAFAKINIAFELINTVNGKTTTLMKSCGGGTNIKSSISFIFSDKTRYLHDIIKLENTDIDDEAFELFKLDKCKVDFKKIDHVRFEGYISGLKNITKNSVDYIFLSVNRRPIGNTNIKKAIKTAYLNTNPSFGIIFVLQILLPSNYFDVNCSPLKDTMECMIMDLILAKIYSCIVYTLKKNNPSESCELNKRKIDDFENSASLSQKRTGKPVRLVNKVAKITPKISEIDEAENDSSLSNNIVSSYDSFAKKREAVYGLINSTMLSQVHDKKTPDKRTNEPTPLPFGDDCEEVFVSPESVVTVNSITSIIDETDDVISDSINETKNITNIVNETTNIVDETTNIFPETGDITSIEQPETTGTGFYKNNFTKIDIKNRPQVVMKFSMKELYASTKVVSEEPSLPAINDIQLVFGVQDETNAEEVLKLRINKKDFAKMEVIGQFNNGFIIGKLKNEVFIIDQHASDEIYNFEKLQRNKCISPQPLLKPIKIKLGAVYESAIRDNINIFEKNGFRFSCNKGNNNDEAIELLYVPHLEGYTFSISDIEEMAVHLADFPGSNYRPTKIRKIFASKACRSSVMVGHPLSVNKMKSILENLSKIDSPWNCPHGRPTVRQLYYQND